MRVFGYYLAHSFKNSIRKIFRTWVAIYIVFIILMAVVGGLIGYSASHLSEGGKKEEIRQEESYDRGDGGKDSRAKNQAQSQEYPLAAALGIQGVSGRQIGMALPFLVGFLVLLFALYSAGKNGSAIFQMADVNLLFTSSMRPQSILAFRTMMQTILLFVSAIWMSFQIPNFINMGMGLMGAISLVAVWALLLIFIQFVSIVVYSLLSLREGRYRNLSHYIVYVMLGLLAFALLYYIKTSGSSPLMALIEIATSDQIRFVPYLGWLAAFSWSMTAGDMGGAVLWMGAFVLGMIVLALIIWKIPVFFYEDALPQAEKRQKMMEASRAKGKPLESNKKRSKIAGYFRYDAGQMGRGLGANAFFFKALHSWRSEAVRGVISRNALINLAIGIGSYLVNDRLGLTDPNRLLAVYFAAMIIFIFMMSAGTHLNQELERDFIFLVPEPVWKKLAFTVLSDLVCDLMDILPGWIIFNLLVRPDLSMNLAGLLLLVTTGLYVAGQSVLTRLVIPDRLAAMVKRMMTMVIYSFSMIIILVSAIVGAMISGFWGAMVAVGAAETVAGILAFLPGPFIIERGRS